MPPADDHAAHASPLRVDPAFTTWRSAASGDRFARSRLRLAGLHCAACAGLIESLLQRQPGVMRAEVSPSTQRLMLDWLPAQTSLETLRDRLSSAGYDVTPDLAAPARELRRKEHRQALWRLFVAAFLMMQVMMLAWPSYVAAPGDLAPDHEALMRWGQWVLTLPVMLMSAGPFFRAAWMQLRGRRLGMDVPVALGLGVAFIAGSGATLDPGGPFGHEVYFDSITMFVAFLLGARYLELRARHRAAEALAQAIETLPEPVERLRLHGASEWVSVDQLNPDDRIRLTAGQRIPVDGIIETGTSAADEALLTGESRAVRKSAGDTVWADSLNLSGPLLIRVTRVGPDTRMAGIRDLMSQAFQDRPSTQRMADRLAGWFLGAVLTLAAVAAAVWQGIDPGRSVAVGVSVLIVTCPCALSLAAPSAWLAAAGALSRRGLLLARLDAIEALASIDHIVLDKTGTLTDPSLAVRLSWPARLDDAALTAARTLSGSSRHPLSRALTASLTASLAATGAPPADWSEIEEIPGRGLRGIDPEGREWRLGEPGWAGQAAMPERFHGGTAQVALGCAGAVRAAWFFDEALRPGATAAIRRWQSMGMTVELLSGDQPPRVAAIAKKAGIEHWRGGASPEDKLAHVIDLQAQGRRLLMIGDGINDAPVLARAHVSVAMGQGADLAKSRSDGLLMNGDLETLTEALRLSRHARRVVLQNLAWAALYNAVCVPMALVGWLPPWAAGLGMALSSLLVVGNAARLGTVRSASSEAGSLAHALAASGRPETPASRVSGDAGPSLV